MAWTAWRMLMSKDEWFSEVLDHDGPACYELGTGGPRGGSIQIHYVGETCNEKSRMSCYGRTGSHLEEIIDDHLKRGWYIWYRAMALPTKTAAVTMQNNLLGRHRYDWNALLNQD